MAAHETPAAIHDHIAVADIRSRAAILARQFENALRAKDDPRYRPMTDDDWDAWTGRAHAVLAEMARG